jgi:hypothetical protein
MLDSSGASVQIPYREYPGNFEVQLHTCSECARPCGLQHSQRHHLDASPLSLCFRPAAVWQADRQPCTVQVVGVFVYCFFPSILASALGGEQQAEAMKAHLQ